MIYYLLPLLLPLLDLELPLDPELPDEDPELLDEPELLTEPELPEDLVDERPTDELPDDPLDLFGVYELPDLVVPDRFGEDVDVLDTPEELLPELTFVLSGLL